MKVVLTNPSKQHAEILYWRRTRSNSRYASVVVPFGESVEFDVPSSLEDDQTEHVNKQCKDLGLSIREGSL